MLFRSQTVAEGVETEHDAAVLRQLGCGLAQGYLFGRPMPADRVAALVLAATADTADTAEAAETAVSAEIAVVA